MIVHLFDMGGVRMNLETYVIEKLVQYQNQHANAGLHNPGPSKPFNLKEKLERKLSWKKKSQVTVCAKSEGEH